MISMSSRIASATLHSHALRCVFLCRDRGQPLQAEGDVDLLSDLQREARALLEEPPRPPVISLRQGYGRQRVQRHVEDVPGADLSGEKEAARSADRPPEAEARTTSGAAESVEAGRPRGWTGYSCSPLTRKGTRLVTSTVRPGHSSIRAKSASTRRATWPGTGDGRYGHREARSRTR